jgi:uncharacterized protein
MSGPTTPAGRVLPVVQDPDTAPFFAAAARHELAIRFCGRCQRALHLPKAFCPDCHVDEGEWRAVRGRGHVHTWTVVEHQVHPGHPTPYTVVVVQLDDHETVRLLGSLDGRAELRAGQPMEVWFETVEDVVLPQWRPLEEEQA